MIGGSGEKVTLRLVAEHADMWNTFPPVEHFAAKSRILDEWCEKLGRDPTAVERTVAMNSTDAIQHVDALLEVGATHFILGVQTPFDLDPVERLMELARG
jgi:alkanesulfonate monooxygenase SsuD/methylene tetrahydromethanopterin reductase-like flavin-dependent oxidoreductase (luciferase family)